MFGLANLLTSFNLLGGICSIIFSMSGRLDWAVYALAVSAILDFLDGFVARYTKTNSLLGKQLDSLADLVSFGVAPGILMFVMIIIGIDQSGLFKNADGIRTYGGVAQEYVVAQLIKAMTKKRIQVEGARVLVMGLSFAIISFHIRPHWWFNMAQNERFVYYRGFSVWSLYLSCWHIMDCGLSF